MPAYANAAINKIISILYQFWAFFKLMLNYCKKKMYQLSCIYLSHILF
ncbi:hypothetical protein Mpsy_2922 [Methanolobus psychrophilus R15]|nr:hypothetical protein Mpsy_2922 [Methanolobus psychrophilus R15]